MDNKLTFDEVNDYDRFRLRFAQAKLTYLGIQSEPISTVLFSTYTVAPRIELFQALRTPGVNYANDDLPSTSTFTCTHEDFRLVLDLLGTVLPPSNVDSPFASFMVIPDIHRPAPNAFETILDYDSAAKLISGMKGILQASVPLAVDILAEFLSER